MANSQESNSLNLLDGTSILIDSAVPFEPKTSVKRSKVEVKDCPDVSNLLETDSRYVTSPRNKYDREIAPGIYCDVYDVLRAFNVTDQALGHLIKKALAVGQRGHKDASEDYRDILASAKRANEQYNLWSNK
jgi:hypothetical protein